MDTRYPLIVDVKGDVLDDGPGIRTVIFFKGCPLNCFWCHNPENKRPEAELMFDPEKCIACGQCEKVCPEKAISLTRDRRIDRDRCTRCFTCADQCPAGALKHLGEPMDVETLVGNIEKYAPFYAASGGGVTLSGGEPTLFMAYASAVLLALRSRGIHTLLETCGHFDYLRFKRLILPYADTIYMDIKFADPSKHKTWCGRTNHRILNNFIRLRSTMAEPEKSLLPRIPLIPEITDTRENITEIIEFLSYHKVNRAALLPNNPLWLDKSFRLGRPVDEKMRNLLTRWQDSEHLDAVRHMFHTAGIETC